MLYILRSVLCAEFIIRYKEKLPPVMFYELISDGRDFNSLYWKDPTTLLTAKLDNTIEADTWPINEFPKINFKDLIHAAEELPHKVFPIEPLEEFLKALRHEHT